MKYIKKYIQFINESSDYDTIRSVSIVVPTRSCINNCRYCVSRMHSETYDDMSDNPEFEKMYAEKLKICKNKGARYAILTGTGEPLQNRRFLEMIGRINKELKFELEIQTSGVMLGDGNLDFLKNTVGVNLISLSISGLMEDEKQAYYTRMSPKLKYDLKNLCHNIKSYGFDLRLSLNLVDEYQKYTPEEIFGRLKEIKADQVIFRVLWRSGTGDDIDKWVEEHSVSSDFVKNLAVYIRENGKFIGHLPDRYMVNGVSSVLDFDCMNEKPKENQFRYLILRSDCNLYTNWNKKDVYQCEGNFTES